VLRNRKKHSRFIVVYEVIQGRPQLREAELDTTSPNPIITLSLTKNKTTTVIMPGCIQENSETAWHIA
jgi:hypothetical protein